MRPTLAGLSALMILTACAGEDGDRLERRTAPADTGASDRGTSDRDDTASCTHPAGFRVTHPEDWSVNRGRTLPECSWFAADSFRVPTATDARIVDITLRVVEGRRPASSWVDVEASRAVEVGGLPGLRLERLAGPGLYPVGTPILTYAVDLPVAAGEERTLVASTVGLGGIDHERGVEVLDAMMDSLELTTSAPGRAR